MSRIDCDVDPCLKNKAQEIFAALEINFDDYVSCDFISTGGNL